MLAARNPHLLVRVRLEPIINRLNEAKKPSLRRNGTTPHTGFRAGWGRGRVCPPHPSSSLSLSLSSPRGKKSTANGNLLLHVQKVCECLFFTSCYVGTYVRTWMLARLACPLKALAFLSLSLAGSLINGSSRRGRKSVPAELSCRVFFIKVRSFPLGDLLVLAVVYSCIFRLTPRLR